MRGFYSMVFESKHEFRPTHVSLYIFLLNQNNRTNWTEWFKCPFDTVMMGACINSNKTYYNVLNDLQNYKLIKYRKGINNYKAPRIHIIPLQVDDNEPTKIPKPEQDVSSVIFTKVTTLLSTQLSTQQCAQLDTHLSAQLSTHIDILLSNNYKIVISKEEKTSTKQFYKLEKENAEGKYRDKYVQFVNYLYGKNDMDEEITEALKLKKQVSYKQFDILLNKVNNANNEIGSQKISILNMLKSMYNKPKFIKGNKCLYSTLDSWVSRDIRSLIK